MLSPELKINPTSYDEYGQPCFPVAQEKGLIEFQDNRLLEEALADGYTTAVATTLFDAIRQEVALTASAGPVDVLEIGGGRGDFFEQVQSHARSYINVEPGRPPLSGRHLERLEDPRYLCLKCSAEEVPLADESVDVILSIASLDHIPDYPRALGEVSRLLRKGGIFVLTLNNRRSWWKLMLARTNYLKRREEEIAPGALLSVVLLRVRVSSSQSSSRCGVSTLQPFYLSCPTCGARYCLWRRLIGRPLLRKYGANIIAVCQKAGLQE